MSSSRWGARTKRIVVLIVLVCTAFAFLNLLGIFPLLIVATLIAYLLWPMANFYEKVVLDPLPFRARSLAVIMTFITVLMLFVLLLTVVVPVFLNQIALVGRSIPEFLESLEADVTGFLSRPIYFQGEPILIDGEEFIPLDQLREMTGQSTVLDFLETNPEVVTVIEGEDLIALDELREVAGGQAVLDFISEASIGRVFIDGEFYVRLDVLEERVHQREIFGFLSPESFDIFGILGGFLGSLGGLTGPAFSVLGTFFNAAVNFVFTIIVIFYLMRDGDRFAAALVEFTPPAYKGDVARLLYELGKVWNAYLRGQLILCVSVGLAVYFAALILGLPNAPILGLIAGILEFIPNLGPFLALIPAVFVALISESSTLPFLEGFLFAAVVAVVWTLIQQLESFILVPRVMGGSLNLHPVVVLVGVIAGASIAGALGLILAAPFIATLRLLGLYIYGKLFDVDPFPTPQPQPEQPRRYKRLMEWGQQQWGALRRRIEAWRKSRDENVSSEMT